MSISNVGLAPQAQPAQQRVATDATVSDGVAQNGQAAPPQDRVDLSDAARTGRDSGQPNLGTTSDANRAPQQPMRRQTLYPGQRGYVPPPLLSQFDSAGQVRRGTGSTIDIRA